MNFVVLLTLAGGATVPTPAVDSVKIEVTAATSDVRVLGSGFVVVSGRVIRRSGQAVVLRAPASLRSDLRDSGLVVEAMDTLTVVSVRVTASYGAEVTASADRLVIRWGPRGLEVFGAPRPSGTSRGRPATLVGHSTSRLPALANGVVQVSWQGRRRRLFDVQRSELTHPAGLGAEL